MRVLCLTTLFPGPGRSGNFGQFVARQFQALVESGEIVLTVINPLSVWRTRNDTDAGPDLTRGYPVYRPCFHSIPRIGARWTPALIARAVLPLARRLHAEAPFDLVDAQFFWPDGPAAAKIAQALNLPLSIMARGSDIHFWGHQHFARRRMLAAAAQASRLVAVSAALKADMAQLGMDTGKIAVRYTGLDHAVFRVQDRQAARREMASWNPDDEITPVPAGGKLLVTTGNLIPLKGQALMIEALTRLPDTRLLLAGSGPDHSALRDLAAALGLADRVHFGSYAPADLAVVLAGADAMVLPSENEGLANAWIEALACGTPLVITEVGGAREVVQSPSAGRLVERSPSAIAAGVRDLLANPPLQADVAANAARFSWEANAAQLAEHYRLAAGIGPSRAIRS